MNPSQPPVLNPIGDDVFISLAGNLRGQHINFCTQVIHNRKMRPLKDRFLPGENVLNQCAQPPSDDGRSMPVILPAGEFQEPV